MFACICLHLIAFIACLRIRLNVHVLFYWLVLNNICSQLLARADVYLYSRLHMFAHVCKYLHVLAKACICFLIYSCLHRIAPACICLQLIAPAKILPVFVSTCLHLPAYACNCLNLSLFDCIYLHLLEFDRNSMHLIAYACNFLQVNHRTCGENHRIGGDPWKL